MTQGAGDKELQTKVFCFCPPHTLGGHCWVPGSCPGGTASLHMQGVAYSLRFASFEWMPYLSPASPKKQWVNKNESEIHIQANEMQSRCGFAVCFKVRMWHCFAQLFSCWWVLYNVMVEWGMWTQGQPPALSHASPCLVIWLIHCTKNWTEHIWCFILFERWIQQSDCHPGASISTKLPFQQVHLGDNDH